MRNPLVVAWIVMFFSGSAFGEVVYLRRPRNSSVDFTCESSKREKAPFAVLLMREWVSPGRVLYLQFGSKPSVSNGADEHRISVQSEGDNHRVVVEISHLLGRHTDLYRCVFHYDKGIEIENHAGRTDVFVHVEDSIPEECSCSIYELLLYALSAAAGLLFLCVIILAGAYCKKPVARPSKPQPAPIYEEMNGVRTPTEKQNAPYLFHTEQNESESFFYTQTRKENPYDRTPGSDPYCI